MDFISLTFSRTPPSLAYFAQFLPWHLRIKSWLDNICAISRKCFLGICRKKSTFQRIWRTRYHVGCFRTRTSNNWLMHRGEWSARGGIIPACVSKYCLLIVISQESNSRDVIRLVLARDTDSGDGNYLFPSQNEGRRKIGARYFCRWHKSTDEALVAWGRPFLFPGCLTTGASRSRMDIL